MTRSKPRRWRHAPAGAALSGVLLASSGAFADYPLVTHRYLADPGSLVYEGRVYLYNSNDDDNAVEGGYSMNSIVCVSTSDMKNWTDHGIVFEVPADASWAGDSWAPQPIARDGTIYLYFGNNAAGVGVASSTSPTGRFKDARGSVLVNASTPGASGTNSWLFDPGALIDDDGKAYLAFGGNEVTNARIIQLGANLTSVSGSAVAVTAPGFFEASFLFKRNDTYYFAYSTNPANGQRIDYLTSKSPMSGWTYGGVVAPQPPQNNNNNHASEFEFNGRWYHAYHNRTVATEAGIPTGYRRNLALEVLDFEEDGSIREVTVTADGVPQLGRLDPYVRVEAETMNAQSGIETEPCDDGGMNVTDIDAGDWIRVRGADFGSAGATEFSARVASSAAGGSIELRLGGESGTLVGTCMVPSTGGPQTWASTTCDVTGATGVTDLTLKFAGADFNVDSWQFTPAAGGTGGMGGMGGLGGQGGQAGLAAGGAGASGGDGGGSSATGGATSGAAGTTGGASTVGGAAGSGGGAGATSGAAGGAAGGASGGVGASSGGTSQTGGGSATAGGPTSGGSGGAIGAAGAPESGGCACRLSPSSASGGRFLPVLGALLSLLAARRRRRPSSSRGVSPPSARRPRSAG